MEYKFFNNMLFSVSFHDVLLFLGVARKAGSSWARWCKGTGISSHSMSHVHIVHPKCCCSLKQTELIDNLKINTVPVVGF